MILGTTAIPEMAAQYFAQSPSAKVQLHAIECLGALSSQDSWHFLLPLFEQHKVFEEMEEKLRNALDVEEEPDDKDNNAIIQYMMLLLSNLVLEDDAFKLFYERNIVTLAVNFACQSTNQLKLQEVAFFLANFILQAYQADHELLEKTLLELDIYSCLLHISVNHLKLVQTSKNDSSNTVLDSLTLLNKFIFENMHH